MTSTEINETLSLIEQNKGQIDVFKSQIEDIEQDVKSIVLFETKDSLTDTDIDELNRLHKQYDYNVRQIDLCERHMERLAESIPTNGKRVFHINRDYSIDRQGVALSRVFRMVLDGNCYIESIEDDCSPVLVFTCDNETKETFLHDMAEWIDM